MAPSRDEQNGTAAKNGSCSAETGLKNGTISPGNGSSADKSGSTENGKWQQERLNRRGAAIFWQQPD